MKRIFVIVTIALLLTNNAINANWRHVTKQAGSFGGTVLQDRLSDDNIIIYNYSEKIYKSTDQGNSWFEFGKLSNDFLDNNLRFQYPNEDIHFFVHNKSIGDIGNYKNHKYIYKVTDNYNDIDEVFYLGTDSEEYSIYGLYMIDTNRGLVNSTKNLSNINNDFSNWKESFYVTNDGWKTVNKRDIPLFFQSSGPIYHRLTNGELLLLSGQSVTNINDQDTITRGGISAKYNFEDDKWTLLYEFPKKNIGDSIYFETGPTLIQMINDTVGFGYQSRVAAMTIDSFMYYYDVFFRTKDGCRTWEKTMDTLRLSAKDDLQAFSFYDEKNGLLVGRNGKVLMTNDGGDSWYLEDPEEFSESHLIAVMFVDWAGQFPIISTRLDGDIYRYEGDFFKFDFKSPDLFYPKNNTVGTENNIKFRWEELRDATNYVYQLSGDSDFTNIIRDFSGKKMDYQYGGLEPFTEYWWRVSSTNGTETLWSAPAKFRTKMPFISTTAPDCGAMEQEFKVNFSWASVKGAEYYRILISTDPTFTDDNIEYEGITSTSFEVPDLEELTMYYWKVQPYRTDETGDWSNVCNFKTKKSTSVRYSEEDRGIRIKPNPVSDYITIQFQTSEVLKTSEVYHVQIFDMLGIEIMSESIHPMTASHRMNVEKLPAGVYFIRIGNKVEKFVKY